MAEAKSHGFEKLCLELHGRKAVYNVSTLLKLRVAVGNIVGANFAPSHLILMGAEPLVAIAALGPATHHVHANDMAIHPANALRDGILQTILNAYSGEHVWNDVTLGYYRDWAWSKRFYITLTMAGYDDLLSIEYEDMLIRPEEGAEKQVTLVQRMMVNQQPAKI